MKLDDAALATALHAGKIGVIPTDTLYGIVASAANESAVKRLYGLKHRVTDPGTIIAADVDQLVHLGLKRSYMKPVEHYWPNPISVLIPTHDLTYIHLGKGSLAVRVSSNEALVTLLRQTGPLLTTSANQPGKPPAPTVTQAKQYFGSAVDFYVDGGDLSSRLPSTIIRVVDDAVEVVRAGAITINERGEIA